MEDKHPAEPVPVAEPAAGSYRKCRPPLALICAYLVGGPIVIWAFQTDRFFDRTVANIVIWITLFLLLVASLAWFALGSGFPAAWRRAVVFGGGAVLVIGAALFRMEGTTGSLVPAAVTWRWAPSADHQLESNPESDVSEAIDLTAVSELDFPEFLGAGRQNGVDATRLTRNWPSESLVPLWRKPIGAGWSGFAAVNGYAVTLEQRGPLELVTCYRIEDGQLVWSHERETRHETFLGGIGPRATPTIYHGNVFALGATGLLRCLDGATGTLVWEADVSSQYGHTPESELQAVAWGRANSPLVLDDLVVVPAGGNGEKCRSLVAYHRETGEVAWEAGDRQVSYASPTFAELAGVRQIVCVMQDVVVGHAWPSGKLLWEYPWPGQSNANANVSQAMILSPDRFLLSKGYGGGSRVVSVSQDNADGWKLTEVWNVPTLLKTKFTNVAIYQGHAYGLDDGRLACVDLSDGRRVWKRGRFGHGQLLRVSDRLVILSEHGSVSVVEASPEGFCECYRFPALEGKTWNNPCLFGDRLLVRNGQEAACFVLPVEPGGSDPDASQ